MDTKRIHDGITACSAETERIYTRMGNIFPELLAITSNSESSSLAALGSAFRALSEGFSCYNQDEVSFFESYNARNSGVFSALSEKMSALSQITERVSSIRTDSEELEIISLNAMVISIKSGEKGRAFSCITENLKRLSASMISLSNSLIQDETKLIEKNDALRSSFESISAVQRRVITSGTETSGAEIVPVIGEASASLESMERRAQNVSAPIHEAMSGIQLQDIIRQSIDQIILALSELDPSVGASIDERLDRLTLDTELLSICIKIIRDIMRDLDASIQTFSGNWDRVHEILDEVESTRLSFIETYLETANRRGKSLPVLLDRITGGFSDYIAQLNVYQRGQRTMVRDSTMIVSEVKHLRAIFDMIRPIIARLQHVRITQQIEVAKNPAIAAVKDTVEYMSDLIQRADLRVQDARAVLETFIEDIEQLTGEFSENSSKDSRELDAIKQTKTEFFTRMKSLQEELAGDVLSLRVYPDSFQSLCGEIDSLVSSLRDARGVVAESASDLEAALESCKAERSALLLESGYGTWTIHNDRLKALVEKFTITSHKEAAGKIGGFSVESGSGDDSIASGGVTLFF